MKHLNQPAETLSLSRMRPASIGTLDIKRDIVEELEASIDESDDSDVDKIFNSFYDHNRSHSRSTTASRTGPHDLFHRIQAQSQKDDSVDKKNSEFSRNTLKKKSISSLLTKSCRNVLSNVFHKKKYLKWPKKLMIRKILINCLLNSKKDQPKPSNNAVDSMSLLSFTDKTQMNANHMLKRTNTLDDAAKRRLNFLKNYTNKYIDLHK